MVFGFISRADREFQNTKTRDRINLLHASGLERFKKETMCDDRKTMQGIQFSGINKDWKLKSEKLIEKLKEIQR